MIITVVKIPLWPSNRQPPTLLHHHNRDNTIMGLPSTSVTFGKVAKVDESSVTATCRNARLEINELAMIRKNLSDRVRVLRENLKKAEDDYWSQYHLRLNGTNTGTATRLWVANFATKEGVVAKQTKQNLDVVRGQIRDLEVQLQKADDDFWGKWQDVITKLATIPKPSQTAPVAPQSSSAANASGRKPKEDVAHSPQPRPTMMLPTHSPGVLSPLAPPAFFPHGPPLATPTTNEVDDIPDSDPPVVGSEPPQQVSKVTLKSTAQSERVPQSDDNVASTGVQHGSIAEEQVSSGVPSQSLPKIDDNTAPTEDYSIASTETHYEPAAENPPFLGVTRPVVGHIYKAYYKHDDQEGWWMCTVLPTLPAHETDAWKYKVGITFPSASLDLWHDAPECYTTTIQTKRKNGRSSRKHHVVTGWKPGYEDGGPLETQRSFPVLFFEDRRNIKGRFIVRMPPYNLHFKPEAWDWVEAKNLRPAQTDVGPVYGETTASLFRQRLEALRVTRPVDKLPRIRIVDGQEDPENTDYRPTKRLRIRVIGRDHPLPQAQSSPSGGRETEMSDAGSLSGDTIAASSSAIQSDDDLSKLH